MKDPLHDRSDADVRWTGVNTAENFPDVATPLGWSFWEVPLELGLRGAFCDLGVLTPAQVVFADTVDDRFSGVFFGRFTANLNTLLVMADLMPGTSGKAFEEQMFGGARTWTGTPSKRRWPVVLVKMPTTAARLTKRLRALRAETGGWWLAVTTPGALEDPARARQVLREAMAYFERVMRPHTVCTMVGQVAYEQVAKLAAAAGHPGLEIQLITGSGTLEETTIAGELWEVSRGRRELASFLAGHGYHGPSEADISSLSWREDPTPVVRLAETYRAMGDTASPRDALRQQATRRAAAERRLFEGLSGPRRLLAGRILAAARTFLPLREVGKATFLQAIDGGRAAGRALGVSLAAEGVLDRPEDIQYLTVAEVLGRLPVDVAATVAERRAKFAEYRGYRLPDRWTGPPVPEIIEVTDTAPAQDGLQITGIPVSDGVVEGVARVISDPHKQELEMDEILVCETTDPSWASFFLVASAVVIDIGGPLSHGAIIARELGIPCVINTRTGTRTLRSGQRIRVDGSAGIVEVLPSGGVE
jgi:pyruvate,water dikinase